ncbi:cutinase-like protein [Beauveria bassiana ARSEF 2860]|uniref:Cutinase-like protein n=1 Tax=Beauveria bassiana (strain ARSEF 2860) TaxID=655819 RepID=J5K911_BEAB2|nr:cutinase-like protein [Beauveria bassiana ARSEF 2860]EJP70616.1 cutinase-like protein [Beauveria bassiana ARSEF 2860]
MVNVVGILTAVAALASVTGAAPVEANTDKPTCASGVYLIVARGTGEAVGKGKPGQVADLVAKRVPGSFSVAVDYPATAIKRRSSSVSSVSSVFSRALYPFSVARGINDTKKKIQDYVAQCGTSSKIALVGFSQGGNVMTDLLAGGVLKPAPLDPRYYKNIIAVTVFGDPTFAPNQAYNYGTNANGSGGGIFSRENNAGELAKLNVLADKIASYCDIDDLVCASGASSEVHSNEVAAHAQEAADFIVARAR